MIKSIIFLNGIYDILCSYSILFTNNFLSNIHPSLFKEEENKNLEKRILERETKKLNQAAGAKDRKARKISSERKGERIENESLEKIEELNLRKQQADNLLIHQKIKEKQEAEIKKEVERILDEKKRSSTKFHDIAQIIFTYFFYPHIRHFYIKQSVIISVFPIL